MTHGSLIQDASRASGEEDTAPSIITALPSVINSPATDPNVQEANVSSTLLSDKGPEVTTKFIPSLD